MVDVVGGMQIRVHVRVIRTRC